MRRAVLFAHFFQVVAGNGLDAGDFFGIQRSSIVPA